MEVLTGELWDRLVGSFDSGKSSGVGKPTMIVAQKLITDPVLYKGHKMDFRLYCFINSAASQRVTFYEGFGRVCAKEFDSSSFDSAVHISNLRKTSNNPNMPPAQLIKGEQSADFFVKDYAEIQAHLQDVYNIDFAAKTDLVQDAIGELLRASKMSKRVDSQFQLFAVDFAVQQDGSVKLLEVNAFPDFVENSAKKARIYKKIFRDIGRRVKNKIMKTRHALVMLLHKEAFNETLAVKQVSEMDL